MSYEGYTEYLCANGHHFTVDCYDVAPPGCPRCSSPLAWEHAVDETNGYDESRPGTCEAPKKLVRTELVEVEVPVYRPAGPGWRSLEKNMTNYWAHSIHPTALGEVQQVMDVWQRVCASAGSSVELFPYAGGTGLTRSGIQPVPPGMYRADQFIPMPPQVPAAGSVWWEMPADDGGVVT